MPVCLKDKNTHVCLCVCIAFGGPGQRHHGHGLGRIVPIPLIPVAGRTMRGLATLSLQICATTPPGRLRGSLADIGGTGRAGGVTAPCKWSQIAGPLVLPGSWAGPVDCWDTRATFVPKVPLPGSAAEPRTAIAGPLSREAAVAWEMDERQCVACVGAGVVRFDGGRRGVCGIGSVMDEPGEGLSCTGTSGTGALPCGRGHGTADLHQSQIPQKRLVGAGSVLEARPASPGPWGRKRRAGEGGGASYNPAPPITAGCQRVRHGWPLALAGVVSPQVPGMPGRKPLCRAVRMNLEGSYKVVRIRCRRDSPQSSRTYAQSTRWILSMPGAALCRRCDAMRWAGSGGRRTATNTAEHPWLIRRIRGACRHLLKRKPKYLVVMERRCSNYPCTSVRTSAKYGCAAG